MLDFWVAGSGLTAISLYIKDSATKTLSRDVRFHSLSQLPAGVSIVGNTDDGFYRIQVALSALRTSSNDTLSSDSPGACGMGVAQHFDRLVFADIGGMGFTLVLDDIRLLSKDAISASAGESSLMSANNLRPPVFADDLLGLKAGRMRYIMKVKPGTPPAAVANICNELAGVVAGKGLRRFMGTCNTPLATVSAALALRKGRVSVVLSAQHGMAASAHQAHAAQHASSDAAMQASQHTRC